MNFKKSQFAIQDKNSKDLDNAKDHDNAEDFPSIAVLIRKKGGSNTVHHRRDLDSLG